MASLWVDLRSTNPLSPSRAFPLIKKMANAVESSTWRCPCLETRPRNLSGNSIAKPVWKLDRETCLETRSRKQSGCHQPE